jgi:putative FmdB family regulatory protein
MPIYEYRRPDGSTFEVLQKFSDDTLTHDPDNPEIPVEKVLHAPAIHFKGKGFHNTDYGTRRRNRELEKSAETGSNEWPDKKADKDKAAGKDKPAASSSTSSSSGGDAKPAAKSDTKPAPKAA